MRNTLRFALLGGLAIGLAAPGHVLAQTTTITPTPATPPATNPAAPPVVSGPGVPVTPRTDGTATTQTGRTDDDSRRVVDAAMLEEGANSFTEGQTRSRLEDAGFIAVEALRKDDRGFWRGQAMRNGQVTEVAMDFRGRIAAGPNLATLGRGASGISGSGTSGSATTGAAPIGTVPMGTAPVATPGTRPDPSTTVPSSPTPSVTGARPGAAPDGTAGNPPSTAVGRAVDRAQGQTPRPDGTPGNPPGTAAGRALDGTTGSNTPGTTPTPTPPVSR